MTSGTPEPQNDPHQPHLPQPPLPGPVDSTAAGSPLRPYQPDQAPSVQDTPGWRANPRSAYPVPHAGGQAGATSPSLVGFFSSVKRTGRWEVPAELTLVEGFADAQLDLREAVVTSPVVKVTIYGAFSDTKIIVPPGVAVDMTGGFALFSDEKAEQRGDVDPAAYRLKVEHYGAFAGVKVITLAPGEEEPKWWKKFT